MSVMNKGNLLLKFINFSINILVVLLFFIFYFECLLLWLDLDFFKIKKRCIEFNGKWLQVQIYGLLYKCQVNMFGYWLSFFICVYICF